ncbi:MULTISPECIES: hypothetical protein [Rhodococcus]|uniref:hypothetical protein n=1 Tax=Rhodococcus TaxID=1827 RepID=UPI0007AE4504|nr:MULTISPECIES: hypothetical protein [Rhodococcus]KZL30478.1 hypothetical protein A3852_23105 [Rhodococcus qingshengii]MCE4165055.1 hypothetical protein [Rhodococcus sp. Ni2]
MTNDTAPVSNQVIPVVIDLATRTQPVRLVLDLNEVWDSWLGFGPMEDDEFMTIDRELQRKNLTHGQRSALVDEQANIEALFESDRRAYAAAYTTAVHEAAATYGITVPVVVVIATRGQHGAMWDNLAEELHRVARQKTPVPGSGLVPGDYPRPEGKDPLSWTVAKGEQAAGRTYRARVAAAANQI